MSEDKESNLFPPGDALCTLTSCFCLMSPTFLTWAVFLPSPWPGKSTPEILPRPRQTSSSPRHVCASPPSQCGLSQARSPVQPLLGCHVPCLSTVWPVPVPGTPLSTLLYSALTLRWSQPRATHQPMSLFLDPGLSRALHSHSQL